MFKNLQLFAHTTNEFCKKQFLTEHLENTAVISAEFARQFEAEDLAYVAGLYHDAGKASKDFQDRLRGIEKQVDHSSAGAQEVERSFVPWGRLIAYVISGHHGGMLDFRTDAGSSLQKRLNKEIEYIKAVPFKYITKWINNKLVVDHEEPPFFVKIKDRKFTVQQNLHYSLMFLTRMIFSCLVDADFLDTERFMNFYRSSSRITIKHNITELHRSFMEKMRKFQENSVTDINKTRNEVFSDCIQAASQKPGFFSLTVPTGGGKTLSSMGFALEHACKYDKQRIIYVIPYTSIIEQNADVFRDFLGEQAVVEHHSNVDPEFETEFNRLHSENWDAPVIVTTNVQFFESLHSNKVSRSRKLHNITKSVIILDEAQMFPPALLIPILKSLETLVYEYSCSIVLCTATQPALNKSDFLPEGLVDVREIVRDRNELYRKMNRVKTEYIYDRMSFEDISFLLQQEEQVLCIVNKKKDARRIYEFLSNENNGDTFHLSANMCPMHRREKLYEIKSRLEKGLSCRLISTQLIEAGVDIDFPVVYRAMAGLDSIAQAAGRCNREAELEYGKVCVFQTEDGLLPGQMKRSAESGLKIISANDGDFLSHDSNTKFFSDFYRKEGLIESKDGRGFDRKGIMRYVGSNSGEFFFQSMASAFRFIEQDTCGLIVPWKRDWIEELEQYRHIGFFPRDIRRELQQYTVNLYQNQLMGLKQDNCVFDFFNDGQYLFLKTDEISKKRYDSELGVLIDYDQMNDIDTMIL